MKLFDLEIIGQGHSLRNKGQKGQSHEIHKISLLESYDDRFFLLKMNHAIILCQKICLK